MVLGIVLDHAGNEMNLLGVLNLNYSQPKFIIEHHSRNNILGGSYPKKIISDDLAVGEPTVNFSFLNTLEVKVPQSVVNSTARKKYSVHLFQIQSPTKINVLF